MVAKRESIHSRRAFMIRSAMMAGALAAGCRTVRRIPEGGDVATDLDRWVAETMQAEHVPGLSACFIREGKIAWSKGYG